MIAWIVRHFVFASRPVVIEGLARAECSNSFELFDNLEQKIAPRGDGMLSDNYLSKQWEVRMHELDRCEKVLRERESLICLVVSMTRTLALRI